jgi:hypothetical protein
MVRVQPTFTLKNIYVSVGVMKDYKLKLRNLFIYYESTKRKLKTKYICGCRCYERLQPNTKEFTTGEAIGTGPVPPGPDRVFLDPPKNPIVGWSHLLDLPKNPGLGWSHLSDPLQNPIVGWSHLWPTGRPGPGTGTGDRDRVLGFSKCHHVQLWG